jgi:HPt (histidine-containing phosphotransfer) domain-containing protein
MPDKKDSKAQAAEAAAGIIIDGLDAMDGVRRFAYKSALYKKSLLAFAHGAKDDSARITEAYKAGDSKKIAQLLHTVKGTAGNLGAKELYQKAADLETSVLNGSSDKVPELVSEFLSEFSGLSDRIIEALSDNLDGEAQETGDKEEAKELILSLKGYVESFDPAKCEEVIVKLKKKRWSFINKEKLESLYKHIEGFNYDLALSEAEEIIGGIFDAR